MSVTEAFTGGLHNDKPGTGKVPGDWSPALPAPILQMGKLRVGKSPPCLQDPSEGHIASLWWTPASPLQQ